jgi:hypothetical protein
MTTKQHKLIALLIVLKVIAAFYQIVATNGALNFRALLDLHPML